MDPAKREAILQYLDSTKTVEESLVSQIVTMGEDPDFAMEPEDKYFFPSELKTIASLRKQGYDNARIFQSMEADRQKEEDAKAEKEAAQAQVEKDRPKPLQGPPRDRGIFAKVYEKGKQTARSSKLNQLTFLAFTGFPGAPSKEDVNEIHEEYMARLQFNPIEADNWLESILIASGGLGGSIYEGYKEGGLPGAVAGATAAAAAGTFSPLAPLAEEVFTVPGAMAIGATVGAVNFWAQQGAGEVIRNLIDRGVDDNTALIWGAAAGIPYAMLERLQVMKFIPVSLQKEANNIVSKTLAQQLQVLTKKYAGDYATQIIQEDLQLINNTVAQELAVYFADEDIPQTTIDQFIDELKATTWETMKGLIPLQGARGAVDVGIMRSTKAQDIISGIIDSKTLIETKPIVSPKDRLTIQTQAQEINDDQANDFIINYDMEDDGYRELSEDEILATGYDIDSNELPETRRDEDGTRYFAVKIKGITDSESGIQLTSAADRSTILEETIEWRLYQLEKAKDAKSKALIEKISIWAQTVRKKAAEMGYSIRFADTSEGNIELFSDAILYGKGAFTGLSDDLAKAIYIPDALADEFIESFGEMSDGTNVFDILKDEGQGLASDPEFQAAVDTELAEQPSFKPPGAKVDLKKKTHQLISEKDATAIGTSLAHPRRDSGENRYVVVPVDMQLAEHLWSADRPNDYYFPPGEGDSNSLSRRPGILKRWDQGLDMSAPIVAVDGNSMGFVDGRNRFALLRDMGAKTINLAMTKESAANLEKFAKTYQKITHQIEPGEQKFGTEWLKPDTIDEIVKMTRIRLTGKFGDERAPDRNTDTKAFKKYYGESILKEDDGAPTVMYHGTNQGFDEFLPMQYFSKSDEVANFYARDHRGWDPKKPGTKEGAQIYPVYVRLENPLDLTSDATITDLGERTNFDEFIFWINDALTLDGKEKLSEDEGDQIFANFEGNIQVDSLKAEDFKREASGKTDTAYAATEDFPIYKFIDMNLGLADALEKRGYDGIIGTEMIFEDIDHVDPNVYIAFNPEQVKSVFNRGTFDAKAAHMSHQLEPAVVKKAIGLYPDVLADVKTKAKRLAQTVARRIKNPNIGRQNNNRKEIKLKNGGVIIVGRDKTPDDWIRQVESSLTKEEMLAASNWYEEAYPTFVDEFGEDQAVPYMVAWLMANVQASPQLALSNTFLGAEQLKAEIASFKSPGTSMVKKNIQTVLKGIQTDVGAGAKLYDFLDSALGKVTRTIMQDDARGLMPVAIDRHTFRDAGFVDLFAKNLLKKLAANPEEVKYLRFDTRGSAPSPTQYEYALQYMNDLTDGLNEKGYLGGDLKPHQVQAIGWTAIARMLESSEGMSIPDSFKLQKPTINFELSFGDESPYAQQYGEHWEQLSAKDKSAITKSVLSDISQGLAKDLNLDILDETYTAKGFWQDYGMQPSATVSVRGSTQAIKGFMDALGYLAQQTEVFGSKFHTGGKNQALIWQNEQLQDPAVLEAVYNILREDTDENLIPGGYYAEFNGKPSLVVSSFISKDEIGDYIGSIGDAVKRIENELGFILDLGYTGVDNVQRKNNWKKSPGGTQYQDRISSSFPPDFQRRLDNIYAPRVQQKIEAGLKLNSEKQRRSHQLIPDPDFAAEQDAALKVQEGQTLDVSDANIAQHFIRTIFDKLHPVVTWQKDIEEQFLDDSRIRDHQNVALAAELYVGRVSEILGDFNKAIIDPNNPDSFVRRLVDSGISVEDFNLYLHSLHAVERNNKMLEKDPEMIDGSGMSAEQAKQIKRRLNKQHGLKNLKSFVKEFRSDVIDKALDTRLEAGLIDQDTYDRLKDAYKNYIPLHRVMDEAEAVFDRGTDISSGMQGASAFDVKGSEFKKAKGSKRQVKNIFVSAVEQMQNAVVRSEKNQVNKRLLSLVESYPSDIMEVRGIPHKPIYNEEGEIEWMAPVEIIKDSEGNIIPENQVIHVKVDGKTKRIIFKGETGARIAFAMKDMGTSRGVRYLYAFNNYLRYVNTIANPAFMFTNFQRDVQTAGINISSEQGGAVAAQALNPMALGRAWKGVFNIVQNEDIDSEWAALYDRLRLAGGKTGFFDYQTIEEKLEDLEKKLKRVESKGIGIKAAGKSIFKFVENLNEATEMSIRLSLFKSMLDNGFSEEQAASGAKNVTINFNRKGELGQWLNSLYLFANAGLQGSYRIYGVLKNSKTARKAVGGLAAIGVMESFMNNMASEDDDEYAKLSNWVKDNNYVIRYGDNFFTIRLPYGYNIFKVAGNIAGDMAWRTMKGEPVEHWEQVARFLEAVNSAYNPIGSGPIEQVISPTAIDPLIQISTNKSFHGGPIKPRNLFAPFKAEVEKAWSRTPEIYKNLSQWYFQAMGGKIKYNRDGSIDHAVRGPLGAMGDISPELLEYFVQYLGGGLGQFVIRSLNTAAGAVGYDSDWTKAPFIRQVFRPIEQNSESRILYDYEKNMGRTVYTDAEYTKYLNYLISAKEKGNITRKQYKSRKKAFRKAQKKALKL